MMTVIGLLLFVIALTCVAMVLGMYGLIGVMIEIKEKYFQEDEA